MQKKFLTNLGLLLFLTLLVKPFWILGIDRAVQNAVGAETFGLYFSLLNFSFLFNILLDFGITTYNNRNVAQNPEEIHEQFASIVGLKFAFAILYTVVTLSIGFSIGYGTLQIQILSVLCANQFISGFVLYLRSNFSGLHLFKTDAVISVLDRLLMIGICGVLLWGNVTDAPFQIWWFVYAQTAAYSGTLLIALFLLLKASGSLKISFNTARWGELIKKTMPFALMVLLMSIYMRTDAVMLERLLPDGAYQAGVYAQGYRLLEAVNMFAMLIAVLLLPIYSRMLVKKESIEEITRFSYGLVLAPALIVAVGISFYSEDVLALLYTEQNDMSSSVLSLLMFSIIPISTTYVFGTLLTANNNLKHINLMAAMGILVNIGLNLLLIPTMKAEGAALASVITQFSVAFLQVVLMQYLFKFKVNYAFLASILFLSGLLYGLGLFSTNLSDNWMLNLGFLVTVGMTAAFLLKLIRLRSVIAILKEEA